MKSIIANSFISLLLACTAIAQPIHPLVEPQGSDSLVDKGFAIELRLELGQLRDSGTIYFTPVDYVLYNQSTEKINVQENRLLKIRKRTEEPGYVNFSSVLNIKERGYYLIEPGDDVVIRFNGIGFEFSGYGASKYELQYRLDSVERSIPKVSAKTGIKAFYLDSLGEFLAWKNYCQEEIGKGLQLIRRYKGNTSEYAFAIIKDNYINDILSKFSEKFSSLSEYGIAGKKISPPILVQIYDSIFSPTVEKWISYATNGQTMQLSHMQHLLGRAFYFDTKRMLSQEEEKFLLIRNNFHAYQGVQRERLAVTAFPKGLMLSIGFTPDVEQLLAEYYATPGFPEWKKWMKKKELEIRIGKLGNKAPMFSIPDNNGRLISNKDLAGKMAIICFQNGDTVSILKIASIFKRLATKLSNNSDVLFVNISAEKNNVAWQKTILSMKEKNVINLSTGGMGIEHDIIKDFVITSYPWVWIMGPDGDILNTDHQFDEIQNSGELLASFIQKKIDYFKIEKQKKISARQDGPYVFYEHNKSISLSIDDTTINTTKIEKNKNQSLLVQTDLDKKFTVTLQKSYSIQPSEYSEVEKLLAFSDIEGNFDAIRKLLQSNKVIDTNLNWIFGKGHLVFAGDMFDRGNQVTECLWLLYSLEDKAKAAGGYIHFILGNHDIMNMQGYHQYTAKKYSSNAKLMDRTLTDLYNENSEIGRWLRTKNVIEKIGDILFVHAGISPEVNRSSLSIDDINKIARPYYSHKIDSMNKDLLMIFDSNKGEGYRISPFWSRAYYKGNKITNKQLDTTLLKFNVRHIITGHTIVADTITVHYGNKVIDVDTEHKAGKSEALLIEGKKYYRVNDEGRKVLLFIDDKTQRSSGIN